MDEKGVVPAGEQGLTHVDEHGKAHMVDVTAKAVTLRRAVARCVVSTTAGRGVLDDSWLVACARVAGVQAAKATSTLIPLCHPLPIDGTQVQLSLDRGMVEVVASTEVWARTGVEMEALCACAVAGLSVLASLFPLDPSASIEELTLWHKSGGRSGTYRRRQDGQETAPSDLPGLEMGS